MKEVLYFLMFLRTVCNANLHFGDIQHNTDDSRGPVTCPTTSHITSPFLIGSIDTRLRAIARSNDACFAAVRIDADRVMPWRYD